MGKQCGHSLLASGQGRGKKTQAKVCVKRESESQRERKKIVCVILKKVLLEQFLLALTIASLPERVTGPPLALPAPFSDLKGSHLQANPPLPTKKENTRKLRVLVSEEPGWGFE